MHVKKGFTLVELLIAIAIIGILASVVVASLNTARKRGADAAIKVTLANTRAQAEFFYDSHGTYNGVCFSAGGAENISPLIVGAGEKLNPSFTEVNIGDKDVQFFYDSSGGPGGSVVCHDNALFWAAIVSLKSTPGAGWCVDSSGASKEAASLGQDVFACP